MAPEYDELLILAQTLGEVKTKTDKLEAEFSTQAKPFEAATSALYSAISGIKALQFHVLDNNLGKLSTRVEEMRQAINEQVGVIALELKKADAENATKAGQDADSLRAAIADVQANLGTLANQFVAQLQRVEFEAKEEAKKLQLIPGPAGAAGASLNPRGTFIDGETYNRLDVVSWLGSSYIAAVDGVKEKPSKNSNQWQVLASRGSGGAGGVGDFGSLAGVAQINQGGTGQTTRAAGLNALLPSQTGAVQYMLLTDGAGTVSWGAQPVAGLPSQTGNSGELLTTDGTNASWSNAVTVSGSNATVTGTLTANGLLTAAATTSLDGLPTAAIFGATKRIAIGYNTSGDYGFVASADSGTTWKELHLNPVGGIVKVPNTSTSTTTSTGALVVGNGTSGGLGVGGAIVAGGTITSTASTDSGLLQLNLINSSTGTSASSLFRFNAGTRTASLQAYNDTHATLAGQLRVGTSNGDIVVVPSGVATATFSGSGISSFGGSVTSRIDVNGSTSAGLGLRQTGTRDWFLSAESSELRVSCLTAASIFAFNSGTPVRMRDATASTTTSSGALVVSGGVGVAGKVTATSVGVANTSQSIAAWGDIGPQLSVAGAVITDTSSSGTVSRAVANSIAASALAASSTTTYTAAASLFIAGAPTANTNVTITNAYALYTAGGRINFQGLPTSAAGLQAGTLWNDAGTLKVA